MKSKEFIKRLQEIDPDGEMEVCVGGGDIDDMFSKWIDLPKIKRSDFSVRLQMDSDGEWEASFLYIDGEEEYDWYYEANSSKKLRELYFIPDEDWEDDLWEDMNNYIIPKTFDELCENLYATDNYNLENLTEELLKMGFAKVEVYED